MGLYAQDYGVALTVKKSPLHQMKAHIVRYNYDNEQEKSMDLRLSKENTERYNSGSQVARVITESWVVENLFCPRCGNNHISHFKNNMPVADFFCPECRSQYELKSTQGTIGAKIADGAYDTMIGRITGNQNPDFLFMSYSLKRMCVKSLFMIPKYFFVPDIIEKRPPLSQNARRAGWVGCNILVDKIPIQGRIDIVNDGVETAKEIILEKVNISRKLETESLFVRGWLMDIVNCINDIDDNCFDLSDMYSFEDVLAEKHHYNHNIRPKIRQQLQILRDRGFIEFIGKGKYRKL